MKSSEARELSTKSNPAHKSLENIYVNIKQAAMKAKHDVLIICVREEFDFCKRILLEDGYEIGWNGEYDPVTFGDLGDDGVPKFSFFVYW